MPFAGAGEDGEGIVIGGLEGPLVHFVAVTKCVPLQGRSYNSSVDIDLASVR